MRRKLPRLPGTACCAAAKVFSSSGVGPTGFFSSGFRNTLAVWTGLNSVPVKEYVGFTRMALFAGRMVCDPQAD
jgi:hypothetical protein